MSDDEVDRMWQKLESRLSHDDTWSDLTADEAGAGLVREAIVRKLNHLQVQFARRKSEWTDYRAQCWAAGHSGSQDWFDFDADYQRWRRRATTLQRKLTDRIAGVKAIEKRHRMARAQTYNAENEKTSREVLRSLALAVHEHQQTTTAYSEPSSADVKLWAALDELQIPLAAGTAKLTWMVQDVWSDD